MQADEQPDGWHPLLRFEQLPPPAFTEWWTEFHQGVPGTKDEVYQRELWAAHGWHGKHEEMQDTIDLIRHTVKDWNATGGIQATDAMECIARLVGVNL